MEVIKSFIISIIKDKPIKMGLITRTIKPINNKPKTQGEFISTI